MDHSSEALAAQIKGEVHEYLGSDPVHNVERFLISCTANYVIPRLSGRSALELGVGHILADLSIEQRHVKVEHDRPTKQV